MARKAKKAYPLRIHADILDAMKRWSDDELRSLNGQIEYVLRDGLRRAGRLKEHSPTVTHTDEIGAEKPSKTPHPEHKTSKGSDHA
ncbi:MAG TPA: hypothetical protein ENJ42_02120 [Hellea balneolensis]|uniref:Arc family DNA binding domain-containing protein n=1 Tax=Hellea balneolensis TaxID=287478 RepID=A0A7C5LZB4_9PROT|nr:hypothetical protein [Hellea balneolensis]